MGQKWIGPRGWDVELIQLNGRPTLRARQYGMERGYCATVAELERLLARDGLTFGDLEEVPDL